MRDTEHVKFGRLPSTSARGFLAKEDPRAPHEPTPPPVQSVRARSVSVMSGIAKDAAGKVEGYEVFLKYLPESAKPEELKAYFASAGEIVGEPRLMIHSQTGKCKGVGWLTFATREGLAEAVRWNGCNFGGRNLAISAAKQMHTGVRPSVQAPGTHTPALIKEVIAKMVGSDTSGVYVDGTFGRGGHTRGLLSALSKDGRLHAFDMDPEAIKVGEALAKEDSRFTIHHAPFSSMEEVFQRHKLPPPSGVFLDLGISSPQFDEAHRGFRPEADGPLDLRFDQTKGVPAWKFLESAPREELIRVLHEYGETSDLIAARRIADAICLARTAGTLPRRTREFASLVAEAKGIEYQPMHPSKLAFQALRIHLNDEFGEMRAGMRAAFRLLREHGRLGLITWKHSECAIVVDVFRGLEALRPENPLAKWYQHQQRKQQEDPPPLRPLPTDSCSFTMDEATRPSQAELAYNSRSRTAVLHILRKVRRPRLAEAEALCYPLLGWPAADAPSDRAGASGVGASGAGNRGGKAERKAAKAQSKRKAGDDDDEDDEEEETERSERPEHKLDKLDKKDKKEKKEKKRQKREREAAAAKEGSGSARGNGHAVVADAWAKPFAGS